jgi:hypothetical protein
MLSFATARGGFSCKVGIVVKEHKKMTSKGWDRVTITVDDRREGPGGENAGREHRLAEAIAPVIVSASRATDIPAFYADWFMARLRRGYVRWENPHNRKSQYISFAKTRVVVFWSKNPRELMKYLQKLDARGMNYYFQFTLNDYEHDELEPGLPPLDTRITTFNDLAGMIGPDRVVWRFDPLVLSDTISVDALVSRIEAIGDRIHGSTRRLVFSFVDIGRYKKVCRKIQNTGFSRLREFTPDEKIFFAEKLRALNIRWGLELFTCGEEIDLLPYGIHPGSCIDYELMERVFYSDRELMSFLHPKDQSRLIPPEPGSSSGPVKDPGQRQECGCHRSKDIGQYNTCMHNCVYCYANSSEENSGIQYERYRQHADSGYYSETIIPDRT